MKHVIILFLFFSFTSLAESCLNEIKFVGGKNNISPSCFDLAPQTSVYNHRLLADEKFELKAWERIVFVKNLKTGYLTSIAGGKTQLYKILSLDYDDENKLIYVLNQNESGDKSILSFKINWQGNVFPFKSILKGDLPQDLKQVIFDEASDQLLGLSESGKVIYSLSPGESRHTSPTQKPRMEKSFTAKIPVTYIHSETSGLYLVYENQEWKKFDGVKDKKLLENGKIKELKAPLKMSKLSAAN